MTAMAAFASTLSLWFLDRTMFKIGVWTSNWTNLIRIAYFSEFAGLMASVTKVNAHAFNLTDPEPWAIRPAKAIRTKSRAGQGYPTCSQPTATPLHGLTEWYEMVTLSSPEILMTMERIHVIGIISILVLFMAGPTNLVQATSSSGVAKNCETQLLGLYPCLDFVTNEKVNSVSPQCCSALEATVNANVMCLCLLFTNNSEIVGVSINQTKALLLPTLCKIVVPPVSTCHNDVEGAQVNDSPPVPKSLVSGNRRLSPRDIYISPTQSVTSGTTSKTLEEPIKGKS